MSDVILHHYPQSPVAEKVRAALGIKKLAWRSVEQKRLPNRPELFAMTGGYRRIPVLQVGADFYCDSQCILRELERRFPEPTFFPGAGTGMAYAVSRWSDGPMFDLLFRLAFAPARDELPAVLVNDRARLYLGPNADLAKEAADLPHALAQLRGQLGWIDMQLGSGKAFLAADQPGLVDALVWYLMWFLRGRYDNAEAFMAEFANLPAWEARMAAIGHGEPTPMTPAEALEVAKAAEPATPVKEDPRDPQGLKPGMRVIMTQIADSGDQPIEGAVHAVDRETIVITREDPACGRTALHFPRVGFRVTAA